MFSKRDTGKELDALKQYVDDLVKVNCLLMPKSPAPLPEPEPEPVP